MWPTDVSDCPSEKHVPDVPAPPPLDLSSPGTKDKVPALSVQSVSCISNRLVSGRLISAEQVLTQKLQASLELLCLGLKAIESGATWWALASQMPSLSSFCASEDLHALGGASTMQQRVSFLPHWSPPRVPSHTFLSVLGFESKEIPSGGRRASCAHK